MKKNSIHLCTPLGIGQARNRLQRCNAPCPLALTFRVETRGERMARAAERLDDGLFHLSEEKEAKKF